MSSTGNNQREYGPPRPRKAMVLCFDGTGNKFQGNAGDSNIIKIYGLLDRHKHHVRSYYQPGIGTYIEDSALSKTSRLAKIRSAYVKMKDQAVGTSFDQHVMAGYDFLMKYYDVDDDLYFFGFSRGAYIARFLAQMLDSVGLLSHGNEEMMRFAWKAFANWQTRMSETEEQRQHKREMFHFLRGFRETFSRPVRRIRFLGLFDTVNSVPRFETAWMQRTKFPYTCKSSALIIRHAVSIDEARAKFRQNLISQKRPNKGNFFTASNAHGGPNAYELSNGAKTDGTDAKPKPLTHTDTHDDRYKPLKKAKAVDRLSPNAATAAGDEKQPSRKPSMSEVSVNSQTLALDRNTSADDAEAEDELAEQDIKEIWFPGDHGDIGGGWPVQDGLEATLSHAPLLWMIREARKAGVPFNQEALDHAGFLIEEDMPEHEVEDLTRPGGPPEIHVSDDAVPAEAAIDKKLAGERSKALEVLYAASTKSMVHNALKFGFGTPPGGVMAWSMMEYMPFRRMDLRPDGTWAPIRWPLPCGEPRDIPDDALIHHTALKRMAANETYRPGNLIIGGGGRGVKVAPEDAGTGKWRIHSDKGSAVGECYTRAVKGGTWLIEQEEAKKAKKNGGKQSEPKV